MKRLIFLVLVALVVVAFFATAAFAQWADPGGCLWLRDPFTGQWGCYAPQLG